MLREEVSKGTTEMDSPHRMSTEKHGDICIGKRRLTAAANPSRNLGSNGKLLGETDEVLLLLHLPSLMYMHYRFIL